MRAQEFFRTKMIYNDLLAIALACVISLLFTQTVCYFFNTSHKKQAHKIMQMNAVGFSNQYYLSQADYNFISPAEVGNFVQVTSGATVRQFIRLVFQSSSCEQITLVKSNWYFKGQYSQKIPLRGSPSIPIAYRKLII